MGEDLTVAIYDRDIYRFGKVVIYLFPNRERADPARSAPGAGGEKLLSLLDDLNINFVENISIASKNETFVIYIFAIFRCVLASL